MCHLKDEEKCNVTHSSNRERKKQDVKVWKGYRKGRYYVKDDNVLKLFSTEFQLTIPPIS
jgi:hypothetical protein